METTELLHLTGPPSEVLEQLTSEVRAYADPDCGGCGLSIYLTIDLNSTDELPASFAANGGWWLVSGTAGSLDFDSELGTSDIDLLSQAIRDGSDDPFYDLNGDGGISAEDRRFWVEELFGTVFGDTNLDKTVNFADFLHVSANFGGAGDFGDGDVNGDKLVNFADFLHVSANFGTVVTGDVATVPEPASLTVLLLALALMRRWARV